VDYKIIIYMLHVCSCIKRTVLTKYNITKYMPTDIQGQRWAKGSGIGPKP